MFNLNSQATVKKLFNFILLQPKFPPIQKYSGFCFCFYENYFLQSSVKMYADRKTIIASPMKLCKLNKTNDNYVKCPRFNKSLVQLRRAAVLKCHDQNTLAPGVRSINSRNSWDKVNFVHGLKKLPLSRKKK